VGYSALTEMEWGQVEQVWDLLEQGEIEQARRAVDALCGARGEHPDVRVVVAAVCMDEGEPRRALEALEGAERSADPALFFHLRAIAHFELVRLEEARDDALRAVAVRPDLAEAHNLLARLFDHLGEPARAGEHAAQAQAIDPAAFGPPLAVTAREFDTLVEESLQELPTPIRRKLDEVPVLVEDLPTREALTVENPPLSPDILGLFVGRHLLGRSHLDIPGAPGAIFLFRRNLLRTCRDREELKHEVQTTVRHEVGHLLGLDEGDLEEWGLA
jgi:predicted Zn-dependent protease with MMP-like domain